MYGGIVPILDWISKLLVHVPKVEQAVLNYLVWTGQLEAFVAPNDGHAIVWTIGTKIDTERDEFYKLIGLYITTLDYFVPAVVHQYDRHPIIKEMMENYYADK
jgi:hypothetical protein